jgi:hypothetical protein
MGARGNVCGKICIWKPPPALLYRSYDNQVEPLLHDIVVYQRRERP